MVGKVRRQAGRYPSRTNGLREKTMRATMLVIAVVLTAVFASSALAAGNTSAKSAYGKKATKIQAIVAKKAPHHAALGVKSTATLPFTGVDLGFIAGAGVLLVGMGLSIRRVTRKPPTA
jgi:hypothetical protein